MSEIKHPAHIEQERNIIAEAQHFWGKYSRPILYTLSAFILIVGGFLGYKYYIQEPNEKRATEALYHAEEYFRMDSIRTALNGDNINAGFVKIISKYSGTRAANLASFYAGSCYLKLGDYNNAVKYLKDFSTSALQVQARAYGLLGDAYSELKKNDEAIDAYKKAGTVFEKDDLISPEYLFRAGYLYESIGKNQQAIEMYQAVKDKYPASQRGAEIDKYLARLGITK